MVRIKSESEEIVHHANLSKTWWDPNHGALQSFNKLRVPFIKDGLVATGKVNPQLKDTAEALKGLELLEVGCGGGILTEDLAKLHANVTALDICEDMLNVAKDHLKDESPELINRINYKLEKVEVHKLENMSKYDAVILSEVLEHVDNPEQVLKDCIETLKPGGSVFITTPNRTFTGWLIGIVLAEYVLNIIPRGTHQYEKFITHAEVETILKSVNCSTVLLDGLMYKPWARSWNWTRSTAVIYALHAVKD